MWRKSGNFQKCISHKLHVNRPVSAALAPAEKHKYLSAVELCHASFTPFVVSVDGALGHEALTPGFLVLGVRIMVMHVLMWINVCWFV